MKILIATSNKHKIKEIKHMLSDHEIITLSDLNDNDDVEETGETYEENAYLKAYHFYQKYKMNVIADDSGLSVDYLDGAPGVYSARYAFDGCTPKDNRVKLLKVMDGVENRSAHFICSICYINEEGKARFFIGSSDGKIMTEEKGDTSFGYDCIFFSDDLNMSFGEAKEEDKNRISHRGRAVKLFANYLKNIDKE